MSELIFRIIGPHHNRLLLVMKSERLLPGQVHATVAKQLMQHGWRPYTGPGRARNGWLIPGTDPNHLPKGN